MNRLLFASLALVASVAPTAFAETFDIDYFEKRLSFVASAEMRSKAEPLLEAFNRSTAPRAIAATISSTQQTALGVVSKAQSPVAASIRALQLCNEQRQAQKISASCEILVSGDTFVPTGFQMRQGQRSNGPSMVWRIDGGQSVLYLGGSIHLMKPTLYPLPQAFEHAFTNSKRLALETNVLLANQPDRQQSIAALSLLKPEEFQQTQTRSQRRNLRKFAKTQGVKAAAFQTSKPIVSAIGLSFLSLTSFGFLPNFGLEAHFAGRASTAGKPILEVEDFSDVFARLTDFPLAAQHEMLDETITSIDSGTYANDVVQMFSAWLAGDGAKLVALADATAPTVTGGTSEIAQYLITERNENMAVTIQTYLQSQDSTFVMVGALHLVGERGLVSLLQQAGYRPVRLANNAQPVALVSGD